MNPFIQGESSSGQLVSLDRRRRGRPRKDRMLDRINGTDSVVGQTVAGFIEASFDAGYLLSVRIGNSSTNLRGVVFKPGHLAPVTAENDVAPHLEMIRRDDAYFPVENRGRPRRPKLGIVKAGTKRRYATPQSSTASPIGITDPSLIAIEDKDVHHAEPLSVIPPDQAVGQRLMGPISNQNIQGNPQNPNIPFHEGTSSYGVGGKVEPTESTDTEGLSSETWEDELKSSGDEDSGNEAKQETSNADGIYPGEPSSVPNFTGPLQNGPASNPLLGYGTGRMTELLQAVQENVKDKQMPISEPQIPSTSKVELNGFGTSASYSNI